MDAASVRIATLDTQGIPRDGGFGGQGLANFNHDSDGDTIFDPKDACPDDPGPVLRLRPGSHPR